MEHLRVHLHIERLIVIAFIMFAAIYSVATPVFEASDEWLHFPIVKHIADGLGLPVQRPGVKTAWEQEGSQPPLYYLLVSPLAHWIDTSDMHERLRYNPHAQPGDPHLNANRNLIAHSPAENFPWSGTVLVVHLIRFASIALGAVTVAAVGALLREVSPARPDLAIGAMALVAFNPMFLFITASVNNDNLVILLSTLALLLMAQCLNARRGGRREVEAGTRRAWLRRVALAVAIGLACLTKVSGLTLLLPAALALSVAHLSRRDWMGWVASGALLAAGALLIAGWWFLRNGNLYGEWLGIETMATITGRRDPQVTLLELAAEFEGFRITYWALFGAVNILTFPLAYVFFDALTALAAVGLIVHACHAWRSPSRTEPWPWVMFALYALALFVGLVHWASMTHASQGRLLFPGIAAIGALLWLGFDALWAWVADRLKLTDPQRAIKWAAPVALLLIAAQAPFADILPAYAPLDVIARADLPSDLQVLNVTFDDRMKLLGVTSTRQVDADGQLSFTLYWECLIPMWENYSVFVSVTGRGLAEVGKLDAYPHRGQLATSDCPPDSIFVDRYRIPIDPTATRPTLLRAQVGLTDWSRRRVASLADGAARAIPSLIFDAAALPSAVQLPAPETRAVFDFGGMIRLDGYVLDVDRSASRRIQVSLHWTALQQSPEDYTLFAHLLDDRDQIVAQWDSQPLDGDYPTSWWQPGEEVLDRRAWALSNSVPAGDYRLALGLYRAPDGPRLPVRDVGNQVQSHERILIEVSLPEAGE